LVSDTSLPDNADGSKVTVDPNLVNPWGLTRGPVTTASPNGSPWWVSDNNSGFSTLYTGTGGIIPINGTGTVTIPPPKGSPAGTLATPTGIIFNGSPTDFLLAPKTPARFIFVTEDGTISGWNSGAAAVLIKDNSDGGSKRGAVYKGATTALLNGQVFLYVTNFRSGKIEVYDTTFQRKHVSEELFDDDRIPRDFAPFNIQNLGGTLFVTYAKQNGPKHDDVAGEGNGFVEMYEPSGKHIGHLEHGPWMNSPWAVVWTPRDFGLFSNSILVGNFGGGWIGAFNGFTGKFIGFVKNPDDSLLTIDGLWSLTFGTGGTAGPATTLFFSAGPGGEQHGLFGTLIPVAAEQTGAVE
jgi:uncharacterized protein (TIGR03118 family)